jgi:hypothetical protein
VSGSLKYFIPEWDDQVDPEYDFINDKHSKVHENGCDAYVWDIFGYESVPFDGILISRVKAMQNKERYKALLEKGVHSFYHFRGEIIGDCGAFGYINEDRPPFRSAETLEYYFQAGFDYGTSIDHLIVKSIKISKTETRELTFNEVKERWQITIDNAKEMYEIWSSRDEYFKSIRLIGAIQGWDVSSYRRAVRELLKIGYDYIGVGGLARKSTSSIVEILKGVCFEVRKFMEKTRKRVDIHAFGVARPKIIPFLYSIGLTSFDSAVFLRMAWMRAARSNYLVNEKEGYVAIRVRSPDEMRWLSSEQKETLRPLEQKVLSLLRDYNEGKVPLSELLQPLEEYEKRSRKEGSKPIPISEYVHTLKNRPWKSCNCPICSKLGIEVIIFRGNNRNRRRGFHNTHVFYRWLRKVTPKVMIFTSCTAEKNPAPGLIPAYVRYSASPIFKAFWNKVYDLPVDIKILSAKFGLIDWSERIPYYDQKMTPSHIPVYVEELITKLQRYDKIFFVGLGLYREVAEQVKEKAGYDIEIFPKIELTDRGKIDILEYTRQLPFFRDAVILYLPKTCRPKSIEELSKIVQKSLEEYFL